MDVVARASVARASHGLLSSCVLHVITVLQLLLYWRCLVRKFASTAHTRERFTFLIHVTPPCHASRFILFLHTRFTAHRGARMMHGLLD